MASKLVELLRSGEKDQFRIQYDEENGELYVNDKKVAYDLSLTWWQNVLAILVSMAVIVDCIFNVLSYFYK